MAEIGQLFLIGALALAAYTLSIGIGLGGHWAYNELGWEELATLLKTLLIRGLSELCKNCA